MHDEYFVHPRSIVRKIWGNGDNILFIFGGSAAEFALNKAVDWLYFTGLLPQDPLGRLFSTVKYARQIVFSNRSDAMRAIDTISSIHENVESRRGEQIPEWAYRDVLFMLIDYSIRSFELLEREMNAGEKAEVFDVFIRVGKRMNIKDLPSNIADWEKMRQHHLEHHLQRTDYTDDLYQRYRQHLGDFRYWILLEVQNGLVPQTVREHLGFGRKSILKPGIRLYQLANRIGIGRPLKTLLLPTQYKQEILDLDQVSDSNTPS